MGIRVVESHGVCRLIFEGSLTCEFASELEDRIIDALRRHTRFELDLAGVREIDLCGLHLLRIVETVAGEQVATIAASTLVEQARQRLFSRGRGTWLRNAGSGRHAL